MNSPDSSHRSDLAHRLGQTEDLAATLFRLLGIDPDDEFLTPEGRPVKIVNNGRVIDALL